MYVSMNSRTNKCAPLITLLNSYGNELRDVFNSDVNGSESCVGQGSVCVRTCVFVLQPVTSQRNMPCMCICTAPN